MVLHLALVGAHLALHASAALSFVINFTPRMLHSFALRRRIYIYARYKDYTASQSVVLSNIHHYL